MSDSLSCMSSAMTGIGAASAKGAAKEDNATLVATTPEKFYGNVKRTITNNNRRTQNQKCSLDMTLLAQNKTLENTTKTCIDVEYPWDGRTNSLYLVSSFV